MIHNIALRLLNIFLVFPSQKLYHPKIMNTSALRDLFSAISAKYLSATDADPMTSNGHEIGGLSSMRKCWGKFDDRIDIPARFIYLGIDDDDPIEASSSLSWYDSRKMVSERGPEWRVYYKDNDVTRVMKTGDFFVLAQLENGEAFCAIAPAGSSGEKRLRMLFGIADIKDRGHIEFDDDPVGIALDFQARYILDALGIEYTYEDDNLIDMLTAKFGDVFPSTRVFSEFARDHFQRINHLALDDPSPDTILMEWYETEELLFRTFEKKLINQRLETSFSTSDDFVDFAKSIMNRRSSRAGFALENHVEEIFKIKGISYTRGAITENNSKPDFVFPSIGHYKDAYFPDRRLTMLALKATCKDRWRQALAEAKRIEEKHLLTLEPSISENQTNEMRDWKTQLVIPLKLHATYSASQQEWLWSIQRFLDFVKKRQ
jgi:hypothetical protein